MCPCLLASSMAHMPGGRFRRCNEHELEASLKAHRNTSSGHLVCHNLPSAVADANELPTQLSTRSSRDRGGTGRELPVAGDGYQKKKPFLTRYVGVSMRLKAQNENEESLSERDLRCLKWNSSSPGLSSQSVQWPASPQSVGKPRTERRDTGDMPALAWSIWSCGFRMKGTPG